MRHGHAAVALIAALAAPLAARAQEPAPPATPTPSPSPSPAAGEREQGSFLTRKIRSALSDSEGGRKGFHWGPFYPAVDIPSTGSGPGPALHFWAPDIRGSLFDIHASADYSIHHYQYYDLQLGALPHRARHKPVFTTGTDSFYPMSDLYKSAGIRRFDLYANLHHRRYPREHFYGLGPDSTAADRTDYTLHDTLLEVVGEYRLASWMTVNARGGLLQTSLSEGRDKSAPDTQDVFDDRGAPGLGRQPDYLHASAGALVDTRDEPGNPHRGSTLGIALTRYDERQGSEFQFNRLTVDARQFVGLGAGRRHVLAVRALGSFDRPDSGGRVPFYLQSALGGSHILRGFRSFRFRDENLIAFSGEYRFEVVPKVELAVFYDAGKVFADRKDLDLRGLETSWGGGLRFKSPKKVRLRVDLGHSREGTRLHLKFSPAF
ncbi:MAG TPA: BamA/TamA family outer membrane protein [Vicinamibacteria bacterium]